MRGLYLHGGRVDIWFDKDRMGQKLGHVDVAFGPSQSIRAWALMKYAFNLWFYERWPRRFRNPRLELIEK